MNANGWYKLFLSHNVTVAISLETCFQPLQNVFSTFVQRTSARKPIQQSTRAERERNCRLQNNQAMQRRLLNCSYNILVVYGIIIYHSIICLPGIIPFFVFWAHFDQIWNSRPPPPSGPKF